MNLRLLPLLGIAAGALFGLKLLDLSINPDSTTLRIGGAVAQENPEDPAASAPEPAEGGGDEPDAGSPPGQSALPDSLEIGGSAAERAVLESLGRRRDSLEQQEGQLDLREKLLKATEERIQKRVNELKKLEEQIGEAVGEQEEQEENEIAGLVTMYETMKPKDAARIFDRLSLPVLMKVVRQMKPRKMAGILAKMSPESAERLTVAIASGPPQVQPLEPEQVSATDPLPKIPSN